MLASLIFRILKLSFKNQYDHKLSHLVEVISVFISLFIYFYVSKAFGAPVEGELLKYKVDYFSYVVFGEIFISLPLFFLVGPFFKLKSLALDGSLETYLSLPISLNRFILVLSFWNFAQSLKRVGLTFLIAVLFFGMQFEMLTLLKLLIIVIVSTPIFLGIGLSLCYFLFVYGRGGSLIGYVNTFVAISSGSFFPLAVMPSWFSEFCLNVSPFTLFLESARSLYAHTLSHELFLIVIVKLLLWGMFLPIGRLCISLGINFYRKSGRPLIISHY
ncbi:hypothetical protein A9Q84_10120 [Halobacteriovorax marinus]|uniref:Transport permease protein n=1 Tax=Halobacteriovorax marinus TaxID=97084 RepID=A0A1Y5FCM7_9BACT|nr:hypothetical protein A9Q84_10120 [Halobacteriovorax marinus]